MVFAKYDGSTLENVEGVLSAKEIGVKEPDSVDVLIDVETGLDIRKGIFNELSKKEKRPIFYSE